MSIATKQSSDASPSNWSQEPWSRVKQAIHTRWPHVGDQDLSKLACDVDEVVKFLREFTETSVDEIKSVVGEFAPLRSPMQTVTKAAELVAGHVGPPVQSAVQRVRYELDEHRGTATGLVFIAGIVVGVLATLSLRSPAPAPSRLSDYMPSRWSR